jgi:hypothetical protein
VLKIEHWRRWIETGECKCFQDFLYSTVLVKNIGLLFVGLCGDLKRNQRKFQSFNLIGWGFHSGTYFPLPMSSMVTTWTRCGTQKTLKRRIDAPHLKNIYSVLAVPQLMRLDADFSPQRPGFIPRWLKIRSMMDEVALEQVSLELLRSSFLTRHLASLGIKFCFVYFVQDCLFLIWCTLRSLHFILFQELFISNE